jgi:hypothetical protein
MFLLYFFLRKRGSLMDIDFKEELRKRDELPVILNRLRSRRNLSRNRKN